MSDGIIAGKKLLYKNQLIYFWYVASFHLILELLVYESLLLLFLHP